MILGKEEIPMGDFDTIIRHRAEHAERLRRERSDHAAATSHTTVGGAVRTRAARILRGLAARIDPAMHARTLRST